MTYNHYMKIRFFTVLMFLFILCVPAFSNSWTFSETTDFAYYPKSDYKSGGTHYAPFSGIFNGVELRTTFHADYKIDTPLGQHWLVKNANLVLGTGIEITPITINPLASISFTPVPFLAFSAGGTIGTGWNMFGLKGMAKLKDGNAASQADYENLTTFVNWYYDFWFKGTFMFDTGAIWQGDWTHVVMMASYQPIYKGILGIENEQIWAWKNSVNNVNGWQYNVNFILAYQMPLILYRAGFLCDLNGYYRKGDYGRISDSFNGDYMSVKISPFVQLKFSEKDSLSALFSFATRRSFREDHDDAIEEPYLEYTGHEWFFYRIACSWTHVFKK